MTMCMYGAACRKRSEGDEMSKVLSEKDEKIAQLMEEGKPFSATVLSGFVAVFLGASFMNATVHGTPL